MITSRVQELALGPAAPALPDCRLNDLSRRSLHNLDLVEDLSGNIRQSEVASTVPVSQVFVIESEQMQNGGVQIMHNVPGFRPL